jgi:DNA-binding NarL/FixJ family response regulator
LELTRREQEILDLLVAGHNTRAVARLLVISLATARTHVQHLYRKFKVNDRTQLVLAALAWRERR